MSTPRAMLSAASRSVKRCESGPAGSPRSSYSIPDRPSAKTNHRTTVNPRLCHLREVGRDLWSPRRDASVGTPDVRAEVHPVVDARPVCGPRVVAAVQEHQRRVTNGRILLRWGCLRAAEPRLSGRSDGRLPESYSPPVEYHLRERTLKSLFRARISIRRKPPVVPGSNAIRY